MDFSNPEQWIFLALVFQYEVSEEAFIDYGDQVLEDIQAAVGAAVDCDLWDKKQAKERCSKEGRFYKKCTCDHCGAHFNYGAAYTNTVTREVAIIGNRCAMDNLQLTASEYQDKLARKAVKTAKTRALTAMNRKKRLAEVEAMADEIGEALRLDHPVCKNILEHFLKTGNISAGQEHLLNKIRVEQGLATRRCSCKKPQAAKQAIVSDKGQIIIGKILGFKEELDQYSRSDEDSYILKMIVEDSRGFKVYGTCPASLQGKRNDIVQFTANLKPSDNDQYFGFFSRPRKSKVLSTAGA